MSQSTEDLSQSQSQFNMVEGIVFSYFPLNHLVLSCENNVEDGEGTEILTQSIESCEPIIGSGESEENIEQMDVDQNECKKVENMEDSNEGTLIMDYDGDSENGENDDDDNESVQDQDDDEIASNPPEIVCCILYCIQNIYSYQIQKHSERQIKRHRDKVWRKIWQKLLII